MPDERPGLLGGRVEPLELVSQREPRSPDFPPPSGITPGRCRTALAEGHQPQDGALFIAFSIAAPSVEVINVALRDIMAAADLAEPQ